MVPEIWFLVLLLDFLLWRFISSVKKKNTHNIVHEWIWILIGSFLFHGGALTVLALANLDK